MPTNPIGLESPKPEPGCCPWCWHMHVSPSTMWHRGGDRDTHRCPSLQATITFKAVAEDLLKDGSKVNKLLRGVIDGVCCVFLQQGLH